MDQFEPWRPQDDGSPQRGRARTKSEILQIHSLKSVHESLQKIVMGMEKSSSCIVELDENSVSKYLNQREKPDERRENTLPANGNLPPSIQRNSMTPDGASPGVISEKENSWGHIQIQKRAMDMVTQQIPNLQRLANTSSGGEIDTSRESPCDHSAQLLQPVRSTALAPESGEMPCSTSVFVSRQFESLTRKDIQLEEMNDRNSFILLFYQATCALLAREKIMENRKIRERLSDLEEHEIERRAHVAERLQDIESSARSQLQEVQLESVRNVQSEVVKMITLIEETSIKGNQKWLQMHEERRRHDIEIEFARSYSRFFGEHISQLQKMVLSFNLYHSRAQNIAGLVQHETETNETEFRTRHEERFDAFPKSHGAKYDEYSENSIAGRRACQLSLTEIKEKVPLISSEVQQVSAISQSFGVSKEGPPKLSKTKQVKPTRPQQQPRTEKVKQVAATVPKHTNIDNEPPYLKAMPRLVTMQKKPQQIVEDAERDQASSSLLAGVPTYENEDEVEARKKAEAARQQLTSLSQFEPIWGWMLKSTGVLMSWQRRFFVMTKSGKIKYTSQDPSKEEHVKWVHLLNAEDVTRVESDNLSDSSVRPPADQYHNYCFYVDAVRSHRFPGEGMSPKTERFKFCCSNKTELNKWMWALRNATDVVYTLEERGLVERSPLREHFRKMYALLSPLLCSSIQAARLVTRSGEDVSFASELPTYRKRVQMEDDIAALEAQQRESLQKDRLKEEEEQKYHMLYPRNARSPSPPKPALE